MVGPYLPVVVETIYGVAVCCVGQLLIRPFLERAARAVRATMLQLQKASFAATACSSICGHTQAGPFLVTICPVICGRKCLYFGQLPKKGVPR